MAFAEKRERQGDQSGNDLVLKRSWDEGVNWWQEELIYESGTDSINNPTVVVTDNNLIVMMFNIFPKGYSLFSDISIGSNVIKIMVMYSADNGANWTKPIDITSQITPTNSYLVNVGPGNGVVLKYGKPGRVIIPSYSKVSPGSDLSQTYALAIYNDELSQFPASSTRQISQEEAVNISNDWKFGNTNSGSKANEIVMTEYGFNGKIYYLARQYQDTPNSNSSYDSSLDYGDNWLGQNKSTASFPFRTQSGLYKFYNSGSHTNSYIMTTPVGPWEYSKGRTDGRIIVSKNNYNDNLSWVDARYRVITENFFSNSSASQIHSKYSQQRVGILYEGNVSKTENKVAFINFSSVDLGYVRNGEIYKRP